MAESFDSFARKHAKVAEDRERLVKETQAEWEILKGLVSQFALDKKGVGASRFESAKTLMGQQMLVLGNVAAIFEDAGLKSGVPQKTRVRFARKPAGEREAYADDSPLDSKTWNLECEVVAGEFVWFVFERAARYRAVSLSEEIATELARFHIEYEKAFGRTV